MLQSSSQQPSSQQPSLSELTILPPQPSMPSRVLLSTEAAIPPTSLPPATKKRQKASLVKPFIPPTNYDLTPGPEEGPPSKKQKTARNKIYTCSFPSCGKTFNRPCRLDDHLNTHNGTRPHVCLTCGKSFFRGTHLRTHEKVAHEGSRPHTCTISIPNPATSIPEPCGRSFATLQHFERHVGSHTPTYRFKCTEYPPCTDAFRKRQQLEKHVRVAHLGLKPFPCTRMCEGDPERQCTESFDTKGKLEGHVTREHTGGGGNKFFCEECLDQGEEEPGKLSEHIDGTTAGTIVVWPEDELEPDREPEDAPRPSTIPIDPILTGPTSSTPATTVTTNAPRKLGFKTYSALQQHMRTAHPPVCKTCGKICPTHRSLRQHITEQHSLPLSLRRELYTCHQCDPPKGFARKWGMEVHQRTVHDGERRFECAFERCEKRFGHKQTMEIHYATHFASPKHADDGDRDEGGQQRKRKRGKRAAEVSLLTRLTGVGYETLPGRQIPCVIGGCEWRFGRVYDLRGHLKAMHAFAEGQVTEAVEELGFENDGGGEDVYSDTHSETETDDEEWRIPFDEDGELRAS